MPWRNHLPDNCPPDDAKIPSGTFYRLINGARPKAKDFLSHRELYPDREFKEPECEVCGVSVFAEIEGIKQLLRRTPALRKRKRLAKGEPQEDCGIAKHTPSYTHKSHHTWWIPDDVDPSPLFTVVPMPESS